MKKEGGGREERGRNPLGPRIQQGSPSPLKLHPDIQEFSHPLPHSHTHAGTHAHTANQPCRNLNCHGLQIKPPEKKSQHKEILAGKRVESKRDFSPLSLYLAVSPIPNTLHLAPGLKAAPLQLCHRAHISFIGGSSQYNNPPPPAEHRDKMCTFSGKLQTLSA